MTAFLPRHRSVRAPEGPPRLFVVIDTEEEFDWDAPYRRENTGVTAMRHIDRAQSIFDAYGITPTYVIDYPVAAQSDGYLPLRAIAQERRCDIGAHIHPWVNPPYDEELSVTNSFTMNLPTSLQEAKLTALTDQVSHTFGTRPVVFKAGRYGIGAQTVPVLERLGYTVDVSVCPRYDFSGQSGPDFSEYDSLPFFLTDRLLEIPCTVDYVGWAGPLRQGLHTAASNPSLARLRAVGILSRSGAANRVMLSPEGNSFDEMRALTDALYDRGYRTFTLSFHSPSVVPGHTPYVRSQADLDTFLSTLERYFDYFLQRRHGIPASHREFYAATASTSERC